MPAVLTWNFPCLQAVDGSFSFEAAEATAANRSVVIEARRAGPARRPRVTTEHLESPFPALVFLRSPTIASN